MAMNLKVRSRYHCCWQEVAHIHGGCVEHHDVGHRSSSPMAPRPHGPMAGATGFSWAAGFMCEDDAIVGELFQCQP